MLIFVGIPLAVIALIFALVYLSGSRSAKRYRPGRDYTYAPVWFLAKPESDGPSTSPANELTAASSPIHPGLTGGASDRW
ncbi:aa3-type cytochrome oxidase subunit CtaJ [Rhizocola hellebori]|uniref:aa3-type cytochrome oxidase subunit CtaJ n=1 Tax=Rhizocola hellebori TaxID=1392758 RepID=UPI0019442090|nr:hypothetical protein [Rhizocola hellebori]